ncbi:MAG: pyridoxamine 5'-phosphate oxidase [Solirubrobacteraceae bacterium]
MYDDAPTISTRVLKASIAVLALISIAAGLWALLAPRSFYLNAALFPPYNRHLFHDIGAFQLGLGACLAASLVLKDALAVVLAGNAVGGVAHFAAHVADRDQGGNASDPVTFGVLAALLIALTVARLRAIAPPIRSD